MIPGVIQIGLEPMKTPKICVLAREKSGKSCLPISLFDYPTKGMKPLVIAFDDTGPVSAAKLGHPLDGIVVKNEPGLTLPAKMMGILAKLEQHLKGNATSPYNSIVVDCTSTMAEFVFDEIRRTSKNPDERDAYKHMNNICKSFFWRLSDIGLPTIWIAWLREPLTINEKGTSRFIQGGPQIAGEKFRDMFAGACHNILYLEKRQPFANDPPEFLCSDGQARLFHTKSFGGINCEGRYPLFEPMPANLAMVLHYVMNGVPAAAQAGGAR